jgi:hypothetical protein
MGQNHKYSYKEVEFTNAIQNQLKKIENLISYESEMLTISDFKANVILTNAHQYSIIWHFFTHKNKLIVKCEPEEHEEITDFIDLVNFEMLKYANNHPWLISPCRCYSCRDK